MTVLIELKEKLKEFYGSCSGIVLPIVKFLLALAVFRGINSNLGYLKMLNSMYVVLILSLICAILPLNGMVFLAMLVIIGHCFALHMVIVGLAALVGLFWHQVSGASASHRAFMISSSASGRRLILDMGCLLLKTGSGPVHRWCGRQISGWRCRYERRRCSAPHRAIRQ